MNRSYQIGAVITGFCVAAALWFFYARPGGATIFPLFGTKAAIGVQTKSLHNAKVLATGCKLYAMDHGGRFPMHLSELEPDYLHQGAVNGLRCIVGRDEETKYSLDWLYFGAGFDEKNPPRLLIASPQAATSPEKPLRIFIEGDTSGRIGKETEYQKLLVETVRQMREQDQARRGKVPDRTGGALKE